MIGLSNCSYEITYSFEEQEFVILLCTDFITSMLQQ